MPPNLVVNGSFEDPIETQNPNSNPSGNWGYQAKVPGWHTTDPDSSPFEIWRGGTIVGGRPPCFSIHGQQNLEIIAHTPTTTGPVRLKPNVPSTTVWQNVKTQKGKAYLFSFAYTPRPGSRSRLTVAINNTPVCTFSVDGTIVPTFNWMRWSVIFIAKKASTKLSFTDVRQPNGGGGTHIDDVVLKRSKALGHPLKY